MENRPAIPTKLKRSVLVEAGHRCAIPTCRQIPVELAHITPWSKVKEHTYENLIALCPTCHTRFDRGEIDKISIQQYKYNLALINDRYNNLEIRILENFHLNPGQAEVKLPGGMELMVSYLIKDGLLAKTAEVAIYFNGVPSHEIYSITDLGKEFIAKWVSGRAIT